MSPITVGLIGIAALLLLIVSGMPVGFSMALLGFCGFCFLVSPNAALVKIAVSSYETVTSYNLAVLPLFVFMAEVVFNAGMSKDLYKLAYKWVGRLPGGLSIATIGACAVFAAMSASSVASAITMGLVALPEMKKYKYHSSLATGTVAAGGTLGILIPPSGILIVYGTITEQSIGELFIAGMIPGILLSLLFVISIYIRVRLNPSLGPPAPKVSFKEKLLAFKDCVEIIGLVIVVLGGLLIGWFTPTEAGSVGAAGALFFSLIRKRLTWRGLKKAFLDTARTTGMIYAIIIGAFIFNYFLTVTTIPTELANMAGSLPLPPFIIMVLILLVYLVLGCFIDALAMILLTVPIFFPLVTSLGFDPVFFGILIVVVVEMGMITPPVGMNVYAVSGVATDVPMEVIFKGIFPFLAVMIVFVFILLAFPQIVMFLPSIT